MSHIESATRATASSHLLLTTLPYDHCAFDLWTYHFLTRRHRFALVCWCPDCKCFEKRTPCYNERIQSEAMHVIIRRIPGPFEICNGIMGTPCLRSCLEWTAQQMGHLGFDSALLQTIRRIKRAANFSYGAICTFFCALWDRWHSEESSSAGPPIWTSKAEKRMGISASHLLCLVVVMLWYYDLGQSTQQQNLPEAQFLEYAKAQIARVLRLNDRELARVFLREFSEGQLLR